jgi:serine/threonine-protein phosphatase 2A activator
MNSIPQKIINNQEKVQEFQKSQVYQEYLTLVVALQQSIRSVSISQTPNSKSFKIFDDYFAEVQLKLKETPPLEGKMRFGNLAFRDFYKKLVLVNTEFVDKLLKHYELTANYAPEFKVYLDEAYGDPSRVDYGTGHEMNFMVFLFCLNKLCSFDKQLYPSLVHQVFYNYIFTMRKIQLTYNLEPAGSHGVWGLDDYHFLSFIFGAAELIDSEIFKTPEFIHKDALVEQYKDEYMYINCIAFIKKVKSSAAFGESSPILNDISAAANWEKVANGMVKMYQVEVMGKYPVIQHVRFGELFPFK